MKISWRNKVELSMQGKHWAIITFQCGDNYPVMFETKKERNEWVKWANKNIRYANGRKIAHKATKSLIIMLFGYLKEEERDCDEDGTFTIKMVGGTELYWVGQDDNGDFFWR